METRMALMEAWQEGHAADCKARWNVLILLGVALFTALLGCTGWLYMRVDQGNQEQIQAIHAVAPHVDTDARQRTDLPPK